MEFVGEITLSIYNNDEIDVVELGKHFSPNVIKKKGQRSYGDRTIPLNYFSYQIEFDDHDDFDEKLNDFSVLMSNYKVHLLRYREIYELVKLDIYIRSDFAHIGYAIPNDVLKRFVDAGFEINFHILSFGGVEDE